LQVAINAVSTYSIFGTNIAKKIKEKKMDDDNNANPNALEKTLHQLLERRRNNSTLRTLTLPKPHQIDFSSNDFLSLSSSPQLKHVYLAELQKTHLPLGSGGSRLLDGNSAYAEQLEAQIAAFHGAQAGLLFNSGFDANVGFFSSVPQHGDVIVYDELVHASVHDGMRLSRAHGSTFPFQHNCVAALRRVLLELQQNHEGVKQGMCNVFVAVESIYSMDGDVAPLRDMLDVAEAILGAGRVHMIVDEAHSTGVLGPQGKGLVCHLGLESRIFARLHTFGKALAANGGKFWGDFHHPERVIKHNTAEP
jgi:8-amino-7-oxononanoate synthase